MTVITQALGLMPLLIDHRLQATSEMQKPLATVIIDGLGSSTVLTLVVLPALYKCFLNRHALSTGEIESDNQG